MSEEKTFGSLTKVRLLVPPWLKRVARDIGDLPQRVLLGTAYWAGYASTNWHLGRARGRRSLPPAAGGQDGGWEIPCGVGTVACVDRLMARPWAGELVVERFLNDYVTQLKSVGGFRQALLAQERQNPDIYLALTIWDSVDQAQSAPELPEDVQELLISRSATLHEIVGSKPRPSWDGMDRRSGKDRRQAVTVG
ncbi:MAG: hypothetical protein ACE5HK_05050 [Candidatus Methylomirabilales bacterium]